MGFFNKLKLSFSGAEGQAEANIINALDYISQQISIKDMKNTDYSLLWSFAYGIASTSYNASNPYAPDSDMIDKVFPLVKKTLNNYELSGDSEHNSEAFLVGSRYMKGVISHNKNAYMSAIDSMISLIEQKTPEKQRMSVFHIIIISIILAIIIINTLNYLLLYSIQVVDY